MADIDRCRQSVHDRHPDIHEYGIVIARLRFAEYLQRTQSVFRRIHLKALVREQQSRHLGVDRIVFHQKHAFP